MTPPTSQSILFAGSPVIAAIKGSSGRSVEVRTTGEILSHVVCGRKSVDDSNKHVRTPCLARYSGKGKIARAAWPADAEAWSSEPCRTVDLDLGMVERSGRVCASRGMCTIYGRSLDAVGIYVTSFSLVLLLQPTSATYQHVAVRSAAP